MGTDAYIPYFIQIFVHLSYSSVTAAWPLILSVPSGPLGIRIKKTRCLPSKQPFKNKKGVTANSVTPQHVSYFQDDTETVSNKHLKKLHFKNRESFSIL
ncbi:MAG: hypothetical protein D3917_05255 [Candidatus Electrothrix sp. AX5]|nr:hypothetical protein [Candidatus Electrothrix sp. AX5]